MKRMCCGSAAALVVVSVGASAGLGSPCGGADPGEWIGRARGERMVAADLEAKRITRPIMVPVIEFDPMSIALWYDHGQPASCYAPDTTLTEEDRAAIERAIFGQLLRYNAQGSSWSGSGNTPTALTWSLVPDGTNIPVTNNDVAGPCNLFAQMDAKFGGAANRAVWIGVIQGAFDRWAALTGTSYTRVTFNGNDWDDGAAWPSSSGAAGLRGDIRICGRNIDGASNVLARNYYPQFGGDMLLDTSEGWGNDANSYRFMRNILTHEHAHGLGLAHVCPVSGNKLMEPFLNTSFDGPQHDDLRGVQNLYGDAYESNNTSGTATNFGTLAPSGAITPSAVPGLAITNGSITSIGTNGDEDWYRATIATALPISVAVTPRGFTYDSSVQNANGSCSSGNNINSLAIAPLSVEIRGADGTTVLGTNAAAAGVTASLSNINVPAGNFYVRVFESGSATQSQLYDVVISAGAIPAPSNNTCASAPFIGLGTLTGTNVGATADGGDSCRGSTNQDVWYQFVPSCTGTLILDTCGSPLDTVLSVHSGCPGTTGNQLGCNDDNGGAGPCPDAANNLTSYLTVPVTAGTNYKIRVAGYNGSTGIFTLHVGFQGATNDACASAVSVAPGNSYNGFTCGATNDGSASCGSSESSPDVWYSYTPSCNHQLTLTSCGSNYDTVLTVFSGNCGAMTEVGCNDDADAGTACAGTLQSSVTVPLTAGTSYLIRVAGFGGDVGNYTLNVGPVAQANDLCAGATVITTGDYVGATCGAGREVNDTCRASSTSGDVWYQWVAPCTGNLVVDTCGAGYDTVISIHTGACGSLSQVACNDDNFGAGRCTAQNLASYLSVPVTSGTAYYIRVSGFNGQTGIFNLRVRQQANDNCADAAVAGLGVTNFDTRCATADGTASCGTSNATPDVWYRHTATCTGPLWVDLCGSGYDTVITAYTGACGSLSEVACNDDQLSRCAVDTLHSFVAFRVTSGTAYYLRASGYDGNSGTGVMNIRCCIADFNLSGVVSVQDIFDFLAAYFANDPRADVNASGVVSVQDIFDFLAAYFAGCA